VYRPAVNPVRKDGAKCLGFLTGLMGGRKMVTKIVFLISLGVFLLSANPPLADCVSLVGFTDWFAQETHNLVFYRGSRPLASLNVPYCSINPSSTILLIKSYVCDLDKIIIDGEECTIMTVTSASF
jgi:hypothetical protein